MNFHVHRSFIQLLSGVGRLVEQPVLCRWRWEGARLVRVSPHTVEQTRIQAAMLRSRTEGERLGVVSAAVNQRLTMRCRKEMALRVPEAVPLEQRNSPTRSERVETQFWMASRLVTVEPSLSFRAVNTVGVDLAGIQHEIRDAATDASEQGIEFFKVVPVGRAI
jgi:hypothetical protein